METQNLFIKLSIYKTFKDRTVIKWSVGYGIYKEHLQQID
jgi:hypothetical protein